MQNNISVPLHRVLAQGICQTLRDWYRRRKIYCVFNYQSPSCNVRFVRTLFWLCTYD